MEIFLQSLIAGLMMGALYAVIAVGLSLVFGIFKIVNFAHGEFYMVGGYLYIFAATALKVSPWIGLLFALLGGFVLGVLTERLLIRPIYVSFASWGLNRDEYAIIVTYGLSLFLVNLATVVAGPQTVKGVPFLTGPRIHVGPLLFGRDRLGSFLAAFAVILAMHLFLMRTEWGKKLLAVAQNRFGASLAGINPLLWGNIGFGLSGALAAVSGAILSPLFLIFPDAGVVAALKAFVIVVLGGLESISGVILAAVILGVGESLGSVYISAAYHDIYGFLLLIIMLLFRPQGLFGSRIREV